MSHQLPPLKPAPVAREVHELIKSRWSPLAFSSDPIEPEKIKTLFEAMRWAPSSYNGQPWRIVYVVQDHPEQFEKLSSLLVEGNAWAKTASLLLLVCAQKNFDHNGEPNKHHQYDTGAALENLFLQVTALGLVGHEMAGFDEEKSYELLGIPREEYVSMAMMAVGYPGDESELNDDLLQRQKAPRQRKPIQELVFAGEWGKPMDL
ncbi:MAG: nitroreductase family protein [bacterium]|nr:nitroreductase family protein [bacterium]